MPWKETDVMNLRTEFVLRIFEGKSPFGDLCQDFGISRKTGCKWKQRFLEEGLDGRPDQNSGHERMHRDIAVELEGDSAADGPAQQAALDTWRETFNHQRPHEAIGMQVPADLYRPSQRRFERGEVALRYPMEYLTRRVSRHGIVSVRNVKVRVTEALAGWDVGLRLEKSSRYGVWFCRLRLGEVDLKTQKFYATDNTC